MVVGTIVVHVLLRDYRTLPFITSESPYLELFRAPTASRRRHAGRRRRQRGDLWLGTSDAVCVRRSAWPITDALFRRIYDPDRTPFWEQIPLVSGSTTSTSRTIARHLRARLSVADAFRSAGPPCRLTTLAGIVFLSRCSARRCSPHRPRASARRPRAAARDPRELLPEAVPRVRPRRVIPVLTLALVIRAYFADLLRNDVQAEAARTAAVAQRVIEESDALQRRSANRLAPVSDDVMVWISQVIDQDVNIFNGPHWLRRASAICSRRGCCRPARPTTSTARSRCSAYRASSVRTKSGRSRT